MVFSMTKIEPESNGHHMIDGPSARGQIQVILGPMFSGKT